MAYEQNSNKRYTLS